jgi:tetratricopeptide (TPR) repeat protein
LIVSTTKENYHLIKANSYFTENYIEIPVLNSDARKKIIVDYLALSGKEFNTSQIKRIAEDPENENPFALITLLDELRMFGKFEHLDDEIDRYLRTGSIPELLTLMLERIEKANSGGKNFVEKALSLLYVSRNGLTQDEIMKLAGVENQLWWTQIYDGMANHLASRGNIVVIGQKFVRQAVKTRYLSGKEDEKRYHKLIAELLKTSSISNERKYDDLPYHLIESEDWDGLYEFMLDFDVFDFFFVQNREKLHRYWYLLHRQKKTMEGFLQLPTGNRKKSELGDLFGKIGLFVRDNFKDEKLAASLSAKAIEAIDRALSEDYFKRGRAYASKGEDDKAIADYTESIRLDPSFSWPYNNRATMYSKKGEKDKELADLNEAIRLDPSYAIALSNRGNYYSENEEYDKALEDFSKALKSDPNLIQARRGLISIYRKRGASYLNNEEYDKAIAEYNQALTLDPSDSIIKRKLTNCEDIIKYTEILTSNPMDASAYFNRGLAYNKNGMYDKAISDFTESLRLEPNNASAYFKRGLAYNKNGMYDKAISDFTESLRLEPNNAKVYNARGDVYYSKKLYDKAFADVNEAIRCDPNNASYFRDRGIVYKCMGDYDNAIADFTQATVLMPDHNYLFYRFIVDRGDAYLAKGDYDRAIADYAVYINERSPYGYVYNNHVYNNRAWAYCKKGEYAIALEDANKAIELRPDGANTLDIRATAYQGLGELDNAIADWEAAVKLAPDNEEYRQNLENARQMKSTH